MSGEEVPVNESGKSLSQLIHETRANSKKTLLTLCVGLKKNNNTPLINLDKISWSQELKGTLKPANNELTTEICCRQTLLTMPGCATGSKHFMIRQRNKFREVLLELLNKWPVENANCVMFLSAEANRVEMLLQAAFDEGRETALAMDHGV